MFNRFIFFITMLASVALIAACSSSDVSDPTSEPDPGGGTIGPRVDDAPEAPTAEDTPTVTNTPAPKFSGYSLDLSEGDFWEYRWSYVDTSCFRFQCSSDKDDGVFQVTLGSERAVEGVPVYAINVSGKSAVDVSGENREFAPRWDYLGVDGDRIVVSNGFSLTTLFDGGTGKWAGSGYFTNRFNSDELISAGSGFMSTSSEIADWPGVAQGPWQSVGRSASQSECEIIAGERICPNTDSFSYTENEYYRPGIGPVAYQFRNSQSFSGMENTFSTTEWVALTASSMRGDLAAPTPVPPPTPEPPPELPDLGRLVPLFGPADGSLRLDPRATQIPDFSTGLSVDKAVVSVDFNPPGATDGRWSQGITFRQAEEEIFHAVYISGDGTWGHFARSGSLASEVRLGSGGVSLNTGSGSANGLAIVFDGTEGQFFLNDSFVADLDLSTSAVLGPGDIRVMSGLLGSDVMDGRTSEYSGFTVYPLP